MTNSEKLGLRVEIVGQLGSVGLGLGLKLGLVL